MLADQGSQDKTQIHIVHIHPLNPKEVIIVKNMSLFRVRDLIIWGGDTVLYVALILDLYTDQTPERPQSVTRAAGVKVEEGGGGVWVSG